MKKIIILVITLSIVMALSACSTSQPKLSSEEVYQIYLEAVDKVNSASSYTASANVNASIKDQASSESLDIISKTIIKMQNINQLDMKMSIELTSQLGEMVGQQNIYYDNGYVYVDYEGYKVKSVMNVDEVLNETNQNNANYFTTYKSLSYSVVDDDYIIYFTLTDEQISKLLTETNVGVPMTIENVVSMNNKAVVSSDGYLKQIYVSIQTKYTELDQEYEFNITSDFTYSDYDKTEVILPADLNQYIEE